MGGRISSPVQGEGKKRGISGRFCPKEGPGTPRRLTQGKQGTFATLQWAQPPVEQGHDWQGIPSCSSGAGLEERAEVRLSQFESVLEAPDVSTTVQVRSETVWCKQEWQHAC